MKPDAGLGVRGFEITECVVLEKCMCVVLADKGAGFLRALFLFITEMKQSPMVINCLLNLPASTIPVTQETRAGGSSLAWSAEKVKGHLEIY